MEESKGAHPVAARQRWTCCRCIRLMIRGTGHRWLHSSRVLEDEEGWVESAARPGGQCQGPEDKGLEQTYCIMHIVPQRANAAYFQVDFRSYVREI